MNNLFALNSSGKDSICQLHDTCLHITNSSTMTENNVFIALIICVTIFLISIIASITFLIWQREKGKQLSKIKQEEYDIEKKKKDDEVQKKEKEIDYNLSQREKVIAIVDKEEKSKLERELIKEENRLRVFEKELDIKKKYDV
jgi:mannitol-specific phosphotransferase system IIBC component